MAKLFEYANLKNRNSRNGFDVSQHRFFTAKAGELLPIYVHEVVPGDKVKINLASFTRTRPVQTAAFTRLKEQVEFYFVPFRLLWKHFPDFQKGMLESDNQNKVTTGLKTMVQPIMPPMMMMRDVQNLLAAMKTSFAAGSSDSTYQYSINAHGIPLFSTSEKLLNYLGYGRPISNVTSSIDTTYPEDAPDTSVSSGTIPRNLRNVALSPFPLLAYQKIYQDHYRVDDWEQYLPFSFNVDYLSGDISSSSSYTLPLSSYITSTKLNALPWMFKLHYRNYRKDLFMGLKPQNMAAEVNAPLNLPIDDNSAISPQSLVLRLTPVGSSPTDVATGKDYKANVAPSSLPYAPFFNDYPWNNLRQFNDPHVIGTSIYDIRRAEAICKYLDINQASDHTWKDYIYRHTGYSVPDGRAQLSEFLGSFEGDIVINEVLNQNLVSDVPIAKGNGISQMSGKDINFEVSEPGVIMGIYSVIPQLDYASTGIDFLALKTDASQFFVPEFDKLGMQTMSELHLSANADNASNPSQLLGYAPRYVDYKTCKDGVYGDFLCTRPDWVAPLTIDYLREWTTSNPGAAVPKLTWNFFKVHPSILDTIFGVPVNGSVTTDQFDVAVNVDCMKVSGMDVDGMPY